MSEFEFAVKAKLWQGESCDHNGNRYVQGEPVYAVELPHQCDEWVITYTPDGERAVANMEAFIMEAHRALRELRQAVVSNASSPTYD